MNYVGDVIPGTIVPITFNTGTAAGGSTDLSADGTIVVYRLSNGIAVAVASAPHASITFSESVGGVGKNVIFVDTSNAVYIPGDYGVSVENGTVSNQNVNGWTGQFSIAARSNPVVGGRGYARAGGVGQILFPTSVTYSDGALKGYTAYAIAGTGAGQSRLLSDYDGTAKEGTPDPDFDTAFDATTFFEWVQSPPAPTTNPTPVDSVKLAGRTLNGAGASTDKWRG